LYFISEKKDNDIEIIKKILKKIQTTYHLIYVLDTDNKKSFCCHLWTKASNDPQYSILASNENSDIPGPG